MRCPFPPPKKNIPFSSIPAPRRFDIPIVRFFCTISFFEAFEALNPVAGHGGRPRLA